MKSWGVKPLWELGTSSWEEQGAVGWERLLEERGGGLGPVSWLSL